MRAVGRGGLVGLVGAAVVLLAGCSGSGGSKPDAADGAVTPSPTPLSASTSTPTPASASTPTSAPASTPSSARASTPSAADSSSVMNPKGLVTMPPTGVQWDYQIGGAYTPPPGVRVVSRDRSASPAPGLYSICYVNAFQAQPDATDWWRTNHPDLLLKTASGEPVIDENWNEQLLDVSTDAKRAALAKIVGGWIDDCAAKGFQAVEPDNLDSYSRSQGLLTADQDAAMAAELVRLAHGKGLAVGQKNTAEFLPRVAKIGFDFGVTEQCGVYDECGKYAAAYGGKVFDVEYDDKGFGAACHAHAGRIAIVRRDLDVSAAGGSSYVFKTC
ncbi:MAG: hypothetical protein HOV87_10685 [Catenulispora sp.]|nr:hypothetical protein [Catenulispora sp.]